MANFFSDLLTLRDTLGVITDASTYAGESISTKSSFDVISNPADNDVIMMLDIPSNAKLYSLLNFNEDLGIGSVCDWGLYASRKFVDTDALATVFEENEVLNVNAFDDASGSLNSSILDFHIDKRFQAAGTSTSLDRVGDAMWQLANLDSDPHLPIRIGIAFPTNFSTFVGGLINIIGQYSAK